MPANRPAAAEDRPSGKQGHTDDDALLARLAANDISALGNLVRRYQGDLLRLAFRLTQNWEDAEDIAQDAFLRVSRGAASYQQGTNLRAWLYRIVVNLYLDESRKRGRHRRHAPFLAQPTSSPGPDRQATKSETADAVRRALAALPDRQRTVIVLRRYHELSNATISQVTGWSESAIESLTTRGLASLRRSLSKSQTKPEIEPQVGPARRVD